jgi:two-component system, chemotaxis family, protein-glutamate methylesterase/glutaminase
MGPPPKRFYTPSMAAARVLIADDNEAMRQQVRSTLATNRAVEVVGEAVSAEETVQKTRSLHPDLLVLDESMPCLDISQLIRSIRKLRPKTAVLTYSLHQFGKFIDSAKNLGLIG